MDINDLDYQGKINLNNFRNTKTTKNINYTKIVTIFFNNSDSLISDKKIRKALAYSIPDSFPDGKRTYTPYRDSYWFNDNDYNYQRDRAAEETKKWQADS